MTRRPVTAISPTPRKAGDPGADAAPAPGGVSIPPCLAQQIGREHLQHLNERAALEQQIEQLQMRLMIAEQRVAYLESQAAPAEPAPEGSS
jgi:hypothetical protein